MPSLRLLKTTTSPVLMRTLAVTLAICMALFTQQSAADDLAQSADCAAIIKYSAPRLRADEVIDFCQAYKNKPLLVVNTASQCGFTPQFKGLETLYKKYQSQGLMIVGVPSGDFAQEYDDAAKTAEVCHVNYGVTFDMTATSSVKGRTANPLFQRLAARTGQAPTWNFNKYLISPDGSRVEHFASSELPLGGKLEARIKQLL